MLLVVINNMVYLIFYLRSIIFIGTSRVLKPLRCRDPEISLVFIKKKSCPCPFLIWFFGGDFYDFDEEKRTC